MGAGRLTRGQLEGGLPALARTMCSSKPAIASSVKEAARGQLAAACGLIKDGNATREEDEGARLLRQARFPSPESLSDSDSGEVSLPDGYAIEETRSLGLVGAAQGFVLHGGCGRGKAHSSVAPGVLATERGYKVRCLETSSLVSMLKAAATDNGSETAPKDIARADLLMMGEYGYIPMGIEGARPLYRVMSATYGARSMMVTTDIGFGRWGTVLGDAHLATATVDRIMHHGRLVEFGGQSRRFEKALMMGRSED